MITTQPKPRQQRCQPARAQNKAGLSRSFAREQHLVQARLAQEHALLTMAKAAAAQATLAESTARLAFNERPWEPARPVVEAVPMLDDREDSIAGEAKSRGLTGQELGEEAIDVTKRMPSAYQASSSSADAAETARQPLGADAGEGEVEEEIGKDIEGNAEEEEQQRGEDVVARTLKLTRAQRRAQRGEAVMAAALESAGQAQKWQAGERAAFTEMPAAAASEPTELWNNPINPGQPVPSPATTARLRRHSPAEKQKPLGRGEIESAARRAARAEQGMQAAHLEASRQASFAAYSGKQAGDGAHSALGDMLAVSVPKALPEAEGEDYDERSHDYHQHDSVGDDEQSHGDRHYDSFGDDGHSYSHQHHGSVDAAAMTSPTQHQREHDDSFAYDEAADWRLPRGQSPVWGGEDAGPTIAGADGPADGRSRGEVAMIFGTEDEVEDDERDRARARAEKKHQERWVPACCV